MWTGSTIMLTLLCCHSRLPSRAVVLSVLLDSMTSAMAGCVPLIMV
jgi:hypothetical protein